MNTFWEQEKQRLAALDKTKAETEVFQLVYDATAMIERLESVGRITGNGHHIRQDIAKYAADKLAERLREAGQ